MSSTRIFVLEVNAEGLVAELRLNLVAKKNRTVQSHALGLRMRDELTAIADRHGVRLKIVEVPPGPPVISTITAEVRGRPDQTYEELIAAAKKGDMLCLRGHQRDLLRLLTHILGII